MQEASSITQINLNKQELGEPQVYLKPVEQTLYSATVPIKKNGIPVIDGCEKQVPSHQNVMASHIYKDITVEITEQIAKFTTG